MLKNSKVVASLALANNQEDRMAQINVQNTKITVLDIDNKDYICLTIWLVPRKMMFVRPML